jgi:putative membrane protein
MTAEIQQWNSELRWLLVVPGADNEEDYSMLCKTLFASALALAVVSPAFAQDGSMSSMSMPGNPGVAPLTGTSATDYVKMAADSDMYEVQSSKLALTRSKRADVKSYAKEMVADHTMTTKALMAALKNGDRTIAPPSTKLSADNAAKIALLKKAPKDSFDNLYLQQQVAAHQTAWALHKGYATDGTDASLKQVAMTAVPVIERHLSHAQQLVPASMAQ